MSIRAVTDLAVERDVEPSGTPTAQFTEVLTKAIPTESLTAYTTFVALVQSQATATDALLQWRWAAFVGFIVLTLLGVLTSYYRKASFHRPAQMPHDESWGRWFPIEVVPVLLATVSWGLALPGGPLSAELSGATGALTLGAIVIVGGALVAATASPLRTATSSGTETPPEPPEPSSAIPTPQPGPAG